MTNVLHKLLEVLSKAHTTEAFWLLAKQANLDTKSHFPKFPLEIGKYVFSPSFFAAVFTF
jgi:hypothetical protein